MTSTLTTYDWRKVRFTVHIYDDGHHRVFMPRYWCDLYDTSLYSMVKRQDNVLTESIFIWIDTFKDSMSIQEYLDGVFYKKVTPKWQ